MKKIIISLLCVFLLLIFLSCKGETGDKGVKGTAGPSGEDGSILFLFQQNNYPASSYTGVKDAGIHNNIDKNFGACPYTASGAFNNWIASRGLIKFDISCIVPSNVVVTKAELILQLNQLFGSNTFTAYKLTKDWVEGNLCDEDSTTTCTWTRYGAGNWTNPGSDYDPAPVSNSVFVSGTLPQNITFALNTDMVESWISDPSTNYGIIIIAENESNTNNGIIWYSKDNATRALRPLLKVYYKLP